MPADVPLRLHNPGLSHCSAAAGLPRPRLQALRNPAFQLDLWISIAFESTPPCVAHVLWPADVVETRQPCFKAARLRTGPSSGTTVPASVLLRRPAPSSTTSYTEQVALPGAFRRCHGRNFHIRWQQVQRRRCLFLRCVVCPGCSRFLTASLVAP